MLEAALAAFKREIEERCLTVSMERMDHPLISGSKEYLQALWTHLLSNAIRYTPPGGRITLSLQENLQEKRIIGTVTDTGIGIPAEEIPRIFEEFYRTKEAKAMQETGTGLGLCIVQQIVCLYCGTLEIDSTPGLGSSFRFILPQTATLDRSRLMRRWIGVILGGRLQKVLIASFTLVAGLTIGLDTLVTSRVISEYLSKAESDLVARDIDLAKAFYQMKLEEMQAISHRLSLDAWIIRVCLPPPEENPDAMRIIDQQITNKISVLALGGTHFIAILDEKGRTVIGRVLTQNGKLWPRMSQGEWKALPIVQEVLQTGKPQTATEVISKELLAQVGLDQQAFIPLVETPLAAPEPFDPREGTAGLALAGVYPLRNADQRIIGAVLSVYLFNNDFTLVDRIKEVAGIDTVTIFFGDLRVATNVMTEQGKRAVGTRISQAVRNVVLSEGRDLCGSRLRGERVVYHLL